MSAKAKEAEFKLARKLQDLFKEAVQSCMDGNVFQFQEVLKNLLSTDNYTGTIEEFITEFHSEGKTLFHVACNSGNIAIVDEILGRCSDPKSLVNLKDQRGFTPLMNATISESLDIMKRLVDLGADVNARNVDGAGSIHFAAGDGNFHRVEYLHKKGAVLNDKSKSGTPLHWAASKGHSEVIKYLIDNGADVNELSSDGVPPVFLAAVANSDIAVKHLVDAGADVGLIVTGNLTVLHIAAEHGLHQAVTSILLTEQGKKCCNIATDDGNLPIHLAAMSNHRDIMKQLLPPITNLSAYSIPPTVLSSESALLDYLIEDSRQRLIEWERKHCPTSSQEEKKDSRALEEMPASFSYFESLPEPNHSTSFESIAEQWKDTANTAFKNGKNMEAIDGYTKAITANKYNATYWSNRSAAYMAMKDYPQALVDAEVCRRLKPDWAKGCYRLALARLALNEYEDAALAAFEGCKLEPDNKELKALLQDAVKKGQEDFKKKNAPLATAGDRK